eukprot:scaffold14161_cov112-Isochrysis_galbana.AAC.8
MARSSARLSWSHSSACRSAWRRSSTRSSPPPGAAARSSRSSALRSLTSANVASSHTGRWSPWVPKPCPCTDELP